MSDAAFLLWREAMLARVTRQLDLAAHISRGVERGDSYVVPVRLPVRLRAEPILRPQTVPMLVRRTREIVIG